jgi:hypothetical protein
MPIASGTIKYDVTVKGGAVMHRDSISQIGKTLLIGFAVCGASPVVAQAQSATPPATCFAHPADVPGPLGAGLYPWDSPGCAPARAKWNVAHASRVVAEAKTVADTQFAPSSSTVSLSATATTPAQQVDKNGLAFVTVGLAEPPANARPVWLPKGTLFPVHTMQSYSTFEARPEGKLRFELDQDVVVNGFLVAMKGDTAEGSFPNVMTARNFAFITISGSLFQISIDTIYNYCGDKIDVDFDRTEYRTARIGPLSGLLAPIIHNDMDQHIGRGQAYVSFTSHPQRVCGVPTMESNSSVPAAALYPTTH